MFYIKNEPYIVSLRTYKQFLLDANRKKKQIVCRLHYARVIKGCWHSKRREICVKWKYWYTNLKYISGTTCTLFQIAAECPFLMSYWRSTTSNAEKCSICPFGRRKDMKRYCYIRTDGVITSELHFRNAVEKWI